MIRILVSDSHALNRTGMVTILKSEYKKAIITELEHIKFVSENLKSKKFNLVIISYPDIGKDCLKAIKKLNNSYPNQAILLMCPYPEVAYTYRAIKVGAYGYLNIGCGISDFLQAVKTIIGGKKYVSAVGAKNLIENIKQKSTEKSTLLLSSREIQVLKLIAEGKSNKSISEETNLVKSTISTYKKRIMKKLELKTNFQLVRYAMENQIE